MPAVEPAFSHPAGPMSAPLAPCQRGLWFVQQVSPDCGAYHLVFSMAIEGEALRWEEPGWLDGVLNGLMHEHPVLKVRLRGAADAVRQEVDPQARAVLCWSDVQGLGDAAVRTRARDDARRPFTLHQAPLWRTHVYRTHTQRWVVVVAVHHLLLDFWSLGLLLSQLAGRFGLAAAAPPPDGLGFLAAGCQAAAPQETPAWRAHWEQALAGAPRVHGLPTDRPRPPRISHEGASQAFALGATASAGVHALARSRHATPFMVLLAAYAVWVHRLSGDTDVVVASPTAGRPRREQRRLLGQFVNTLPLRIRVRADDAFSSVVEQVRETVIGALRHQEVPFASLVEHFAPLRDPAIDPLAQLGFSWERLPLMADFAGFFLPEATEEEHRVGTLRLTPFPVPQQEGQLDLLMEMGGEHAGRLVGVLKYRDALFDAATIAHWLQVWTALAGQLVAEPDRPVGAFPLAGTAIRPAAACGPQRPLPRTTVLDLIETVAAGTPEAPAVQDAAGVLTYAQLLGRAREIAAGLQGCGVTPGAHVGFMLDRGSDLLATLLGIWISGAAYVPLDPRFPPARLRDIAADAGLGALVSQQAHRDAWPDGVPVVVLDKALPRAGRVAAVPPMPAAAAYLLYTSGSTGRPKGVRVAQRSVLNFLLSMQARLPVDADTRLLAVTTPAFDISVLELLLPLLAGACVVMAATPLLADGAALARSLDEQRISMMQATPASWKLMLDAGWQGRPGLVALCGGEPLPSWLAEALHARCAAVWNLYGPTETTVWSTAACLRPGEPVHLGQALDNTELHVLDPRQQPVPQGACGELWIGGAGLAIDYWQRPELTARQFTAVAALPQAGRLYRTGDRVRFNGRGGLEHLGRLDLQIKLRGFRIEPGEIETWLKQHAGVRDALVVLFDDGLARDPQLIAYIVPDAAAAPEAAALRRHLQQTLPPHMVPASFIFLDALPLTPSGKIDRAALPPPDASAVVPGRRPLPPRDALEIQLAGMYERLLRIQSIGIHDDFFELGGHSLLAMQVVAEVRRQLGIELPVAELMQHGSVAALAARLRGQVRPTASVLVPLTPAARAAWPASAEAGPQPLWLFHPIGGTVFCYLELSRRLAPGRPVFAVQSPALDRDGEAEVSVEAMARRYLVDVLARQPQGPYLLGGWCFGGVVAFEAARQLRARGERVDRVILIDTRAPVPANMPGDGDDATLMSWFARDLALPYGKSLDIPAHTLRGLPGPAMFETVLRAARAIDVLPADAGRARLERYFEAYLANGIALQMHFPPPQDVPVLLLRARDEPADHGPSLGWEGLVADSLSLLDVPGDHHSVLYPPQAAEVAALIDRCCPFGHPAPAAASSPQTGCVP